ncbi:MAG: hypothetical protein ABIE22_03075 [archaeon]
MREVYDTVRAEINHAIFSGLSAIFGVYMCAALTPVPTALDDQFQEIRFSVERAYNAIEE